MTSIFFGAKHPKPGMRYRVGDLGLAIQKIYQDVEAAFSALESHVGEAGELTLTSESLTETTGAISVELPVTICNPTDVASYTLADGVADSMKWVVNVSAHAVTVGSVGMLAAGGTYQLYSTGRGWFVINLYVPAG